MDHLVGENHLDAGRIQNSRDVPRGMEPTICRVRLRRGKSARRALVGESRRVRPQMRGRDGLAEQRRPRRVEDDADLGVRVEGLVVQRGVQDAPVEHQTCDEQVLRLGLPHELVTLRLHESRVVGMACDGWLVVLAPRGEGHLLQHGVSARLELHVCLVPRGAGVCCVVLLPCEHAADGACRAWSRRWRSRAGVQQPGLHVEVEAVLGVGKDPEGVGGGEPRLANQVQRPRVVVERLLDDGVQQGALEAGRRVRREDASRLPTRLVALLSARLGVARADALVKSLRVAYLKAARAAGRQVDELAGPLRRVRIQDRAVAGSRGEGTVVRGVVVVGREDHRVGAPLEQVADGLSGNPALPSAEARRRVGRTDVLVPLRARRHALRDILIRVGLVVPDEIDGHVDDDQRRLVGRDQNVGHLQARALKPLLHVWRPIRHLLLLRHQGCCRGPRLRGLQHRANVVCRLRPRVLGVGRAINVSAVCRRSWLQSEQKQVKDHGASAAHLWG
mmetsp:Transcript_21756/g.67571  ORF Transcript_21756/g.67571 Transcript_21756/m.67571 type:complete len:504 (-) Transcript_21756:55-1566(-)